MEHFCRRLNMRTLSMMTDDQFRLIQSFEDLEFRLMEGVAHREAEREELHKEMAGVELRLLQRRQQLREVEQQQRQTTESARNEAQELTKRRRELFQQIELVSLSSSY